MGCINVTLALADIGVEIDLMSDPSQPANTNPCR